jgi:hypothetical protein
LFPEAEIFTRLERPEGLPAGMANAKRNTSFLQNIPLATSHHWHLPFSRQDASGYSGLRTRSADRHAFYPMNSMHDILKGNLGRSLGALCALDRLTAAWPVACGPAMARRGTVAGFEGGVLRIEVADAAWLDEMRGMRAVLERELARIAEVKLAGIHFELKQSGSPGRRTARTGRTER